MKITKRQLKRIIKEERAKLVKEYGMVQSEEKDKAIQMALDHLQMLDDALYRSGIELVGGQLRGIVMDALNHPTSGY